MLITNTFTHTFINNHPSLFIRHTKKDSCISSFNFHLRRKTLRSRLSTFVSQLSSLLPPSSCPHVKMSPCPYFPRLLTFIFGAKHCAPTLSLSSLNFHLSSLNSRLSSHPNYHVPMSKCPHVPISPSLIPHLRRKTLRRYSRLSTLNFRLSSLTPHFK